MPALTISIAVEQYLDAAAARRLSPHTIADYQNTYKRFMHWLGGDIPVQEITARVIEKFLGSTTDVSKKTTLNYHVGLSALWGWMTAQRHVPENVVRLVPAPRPEVPEIMPVARCEIVDLIAATRGGRHQLRDHGIILLLLDTGMRSSELCGLTLRDVYWISRRMVVNGKGSKRRALRACQATMDVLYRYVAGRKTGPLFLGENGAALNRDSLNGILERLGNRAGVPDVHAHRLRHTFAIEFLRNGGNVYALQKALGHSSLDMCLRYLAISQADLDAAHDKASPVMCWDLN